MAYSIINSSNQSIHDRILQVADEQFRKHGIRTVRMDDLAAMLSISKRTLYQEFADKETLLLAVNARNQHEMNLIYEQFHMESENVLEFIMKVLRFTLEYFAGVNPLFFHDLSRYPGVLAEFQKQRQEHAKHIKNFLQEGVTQGIFRSDLNIELFIKANQMMHRDGLQELKEEYGMSETIRTTLLITLRGISTLKGIAMLDEFMEELKREKK